MCQEGCHCYERVSHFSKRKWYFRCERITNSLKSILKIPLGKSGISIIITIKKGGGGSLDLSISLGKLHENKNPKKTCQSRTCLLLAMVNRNCNGASTTLQQLQV